MASHRLRAGFLLILAAAFATPALGATADEPHLITAVDVVTDDPIDTTPVLEVLGLVVGRARIRNRDHARFDHRHLRDPG